MLIKGNEKFGEFSEKIHYAFVFGINGIAVDLVYLKKAHSENVFSTWPIGPIDIRRFGSPFPFRTRANVRHIVSYRTETFNGVHMGHACFRFAWKEKLYFRFRGPESVDDTRGHVAWRSGSDRKCADPLRDDRQCGLLPYVFIIPLDFPAIYTRTYIRTCVRFTCYNHF